MSQASKPVFRTRNVGKVTEYLKELLVDCAPGGATVAVDDAIPAGAYDVRVSGRVVTILAGTGGMATFKVGDGTDDDMFSGAKAKAAGTTFSPVDQTAAAQTSGKPGIFTADTDVVLTPDAGTITSGELRLVIAYRKMTSPTR